VSLSLRHRRVLKVEAGDQKEPSAETLVADLQRELWPATKMPWWAWASLGRLDRNYLVGTGFSPE
jgi:hypothetical protein